MSYFLGIDLGTTYTAGATSTGGRVRIASLGGRATTIPSVVLLREDGEVLVGEAAERRAILEPHRIAREFKRRLGDPTPLIVGGTPYSADALTAKLLRDVVARVTDDEGEPPAGIAVCHPANWGAYKQDLLRQAIRLADLDDVATVCEPEAAAIHYASEERVVPGSVIAVYDLGGGTFDAAVLRRTEDGWEILGQPEGVERLGGVDFDEAVFQHVIGTVLPSIDQLDTDDPPTITSVARLRQECIQAKEALTVDTEVSIPVLLPSVQTDIRLTRDQLETMIRPALLDTVAALRRALRSADVEADDVSTVLLVGGSSRIPLVAELVESELGRPVAVDAHPKHSVALGAARVAAERGPVAVPASPAAGGAGAAVGDGNAVAGAAGGSDQDGGAPAGPAAGVVAAGETVVQEPADVAADDPTLVEATLIARPEDLGLPAEEVVPAADPVPGPAAGAPGPDGGADMPTPNPSDPDGPGGEPVAGAAGGNGAALLGAAAGGAILDRSPTDGPGAGAPGPSDPASAGSEEGPWADGAGPDMEADPAGIDGGPTPTSDDGEGQGAAGPVPSAATAAPAAAAPVAEPGVPGPDDPAAALAPASYRGAGSRVGGPMRPKRARRPRQPSTRSAPAQSTVALLVGSVVAAVLLLVVVMVAMRTDDAEGRRARDDGSDAPTALTPGGGGSTDDDGDDVERDEDDPRDRNSTTTAPGSSSTSTTGRGTSTTDGRSGTTEGTTTTVEETTTTTEATTTTTEATTTTTTEPPTSTTGPPTGGGT